MKNLYTFFSITEENFYRICNFLSLTDMRKIAKVNSELLDSIYNKKIFYTPVYENLDAPSLSFPQTWNYISSQNTLKKFYLTKENLFKENIDAEGCYKISISWPEIIQLNPKIAIDLENKSYFTLQLAVSEQQISSYISRDNLVEYQNPFYLSSKKISELENKQETEYLMPTSSLKG